MLKKLMIVVASVLVMGCIQSSAMAQPHPGGHRPHHEHYQSPEMSQDAFNAFYNMVRNTGTFEKKKVVIETIRAGNRLTSQQAHDILKLIQEDSDRVDPAVEIYKTVVDPKNWFLVYDVFTFSSTKDKMMSKINNITPEPVNETPSHRPGPGVRYQVEMGDVEFNNLCNTIRKTGVFDRKKVIIEAVHAGNRLTSQQAHDVLKLIQEDSDRVDPAVEIYKTVVDPKNWFLVYDVFTFSSTKDRMMNKIKDITPEPVPQAPSHHYR